MVVMVVVVAVAAVSVVVGPRNVVVFGVVVIRFPIP